MILVAGKQICQDSHLCQDHQLMFKLLTHSSLSAKTNLFKSLPETTIRLSTGLNSVQSEGSVKFVYVFQREYATVDPAFVELVGTDELTTCVGLAIRNKKTGMTSVGHLDSVECVELGLLQMLSAVLSGENDADLDVHLIGSFDDTREELFKRVFESDNSETNETHSRDNTLLTLWSIQNLVLDGYSWPLCLKIVEVLQNMNYNFHVQTMCILNHNTLTGPNGFACPIIRGFVMNTVSGDIIPAIFDRSARCPDEVVRIVRGSLSYGDPTWEGRLLETYDTHTDEFVIAPCKWMPAQSHYAAKLQLPDSEFLLQCSTSPYAESSDFVDTYKRGYAYLLENPNWRSIFPNGQPRIFKRTSNGGWVKCKGKHMD